MSHIPSFNASWMLNDRGKRHCVRRGARISWRERRIVKWFDVTRVDCVAACLQVAGLIRSLQPPKLHFHFWTTKRSNLTMSRTSKAQTNPLVGYFKYSSLVPPTSCWSPTAFCAFDVLPAAICTFTSTASSWLCYTLVITCMTQISRQQKTSQWRSIGERSRMTLKDCIWKKGNPSMRFEKYWKIHGTSVPRE